MCTAERRAKGKKQIKLYRSLNENMTDKSAKQINGKNMTDKTFFFFLMGYRESKCLPGTLIE